MTTEHLVTTANEYPPDLRIYYLICLTTGCKWKSPEITVPFEPETEEAKLSFINTSLTAIDGLVDVFDAHNLKTHNGTSNYSFESRR